jgi:hypothetical protein
MILRNKRIIQNTPNKVVKSINFLEHPLWVPKNKITETVLKDKSGYTLESKYGIPNNTDINILDLLIAKQQQNPSSLEVEIGNYPIDLMKEIGYSKTQSNYNRIEESIRKWAKVEIYFPNGVFYYDKKREGREIAKVINNIIDFDKTRTKIIVFNKSFINANNDGSFKKTFPLVLMRNLSPFSKRLYEILCKSFYSGSIFSIARENLLDKMFIGNNELLKYESTSDRRIRKALIEIENKTKDLIGKDGIKFCYLSEEEIKVEKKLATRPLPDDLLFFRKEKIGEQKNKDGEQKNKK